MDMYNCYRVFGFKNALQIRIQVFMFSLNIFDTYANRCLQNTIFVNIGLDGVLRVLWIAIVFHFNLISQMGESPTSTTWKSFGVMSFMLQLINIWSIICTYFALNLPSNWPTTNIYKSNNMDIWVSSFPFF
jgi:hypothetical protein